MLSVEDHPCRWPHIGRWWSGLGSQRQHPNLYACNISPPLFEHLSWIKYRNEHHQAVLIESIIFNVMKLQNSRDRQHDHEAQKIKKFLFVDVYKLISHRSRMKPVCLLRTNQETMNQPTESSELQ